MSAGWRAQAERSGTLICVDFEATFDELYPGLFRYCHRLTGEADVADDVAQEAFVRLYDRSITGTEEGVRAWLFRTATHLVRDRYRVEGNRRRLLEIFLALVDARWTAPPNGSVSSRPGTSTRTVSSGWSSETAAFRSEAEFRGAAWARWTASSTCTSSAARSNSRGTWPTSGSASSRTATSGTSRWCSFTTAST